MADRSGNKNPLRACCGVCSLQKKRLAQTIKLIENYSMLSENLADPGRIRTAMERALEQKKRIENWLAAHSHRKHSTGSERRS